MYSVLALAGLLLVSTALAQDAGAATPSQIIHHRVWPKPSSKAPPWIRKGSAVLSEPPTFENDQATPLTAESDSRIQIALERAGESESDWPMVSIPACRFRGKDLNETISLLVDPTGQEVLHVGYQTSAPEDACEAMGSPLSLTIQPARTLVQLVKQQRLDPPRLHQPQVIQFNQDGSVRQPEKEKGFFQKYWYYVVPLLLFTVFAPTPPDQGGSATAGARAAR